MHTHHLAALAGAVLLGLPLRAGAQQHRTPDTLPGKPATRTLGYESAFADYKPWRDAARADWRAVNDTVRDAAAGHAADGAAAPGAGAASQPAVMPAAGTGQHRAPAAPGEHK